MSVSISSNTFPTSITNLLNLLVGKKVTIVLQSGEREVVVVDAVSGSILVARQERCCFKFVNIACICEVLVECDEILESLLNGCMHSSSTTTTSCGCSGTRTPDFGWRLYQKEN